MKNPKLFTVLTILCASILIFSCASTSDNVADPSPQVRVPNISGQKNVNVSTSDQERLKSDFFNYEVTLFENALDVKVTDKTSSEFMEDFENDLIDQGWRLESDYVYPVWGKDKNRLALLIYDEVQPDFVDMLRRSYGIQDVEAGQTVIIEYIYDQSKPLPNPTETAEAMAWGATQTQEMILETERAVEADATATQEAILATEQAFEEQTQATQTALEMQAKATQYVLDIEATATQDALNQQATATQTALDAEMQATQMAELAEEERLNAIATAQALQPILDEMGSDFDGEDSLPDELTIAREDPTKWDLTSKPGWLHIVGRYYDFVWSDVPPKNVFVYPLHHTNISVITRVDATFYETGQSVSIGLTPNDFRNMNSTIRFGINLKGSSGRSVFAWACKSGCSFSYEYSISDSIQFNGPVYLKMDIQGNLYTFYYGEDDTNWIYLGEVADIAAGDKLFLVATSTDSDEEVDTYFDFLRFEAIMPE